MLGVCKAVLSATCLLLSSVPLLSTGAPLSSPACGLSSSWANLGHLSRLAGADLPEAVCAEVPVHLSRCHGVFSRGQNLCAKLLEREAFPRSIAQCICPCCKNPKCPC